MNKEYEEANLKALNHIENISKNNYQHFFQELKLEKKKYTDCADLFNELNKNTGYIDSYINILKFLSTKIFDFANCEKEENVADALGDKGLEIQNIAQNLNVLIESSFEDEVKRVILLDIIQSVEDEKISCYNSSYYVKGLKYRSTLIAEDLMFEHGDIFFRI